MTGSKQFAIGDPYFYGGRRPQRFLIAKNLLDTLFGFSAPKVPGSAPMSFLVMTSAIHGLMSQRTAFLTVQKIGHNGDLATHNRLAPGSNPSRPTN
jgi:hypothetical protein